MSLDVYLKQPASEIKTGIFIREGGERRELILQEIREKFPGAEVEVSEYIFTSGITHNLADMAEAAGIYKALWRPEEVNVTKASELIAPLTEGLAKLKANPEHYKQFNSPNNWGVYENFITFIEEYLQACKDNPNATIETWR